MSRVVFVDTSRTTKDGRRRPHACYDGKKVFEVYDPTKLKNYDEVFVDTLFPELYDEAAELLEKGVKIFLLKNTRLLKRLREENRIDKSDENDAKLLAMIPRDHFKQLTPNGLKLLRLIWEYERFIRWKKTIICWMQTYPSDPLKECVIWLRRLIKHHARRIIREVKNDENYAAVYRLACDMLGIRNDSVELAILVVRLPLNRKFSRLCGILGLTPNGGKNYNHKLRGHLSRLAMSIYLNKRYGADEELMKDLEGLPLNKAIRRLQLRILKVLKRVWQQSAGGSKSCERLVAC